MSRRQSYLAYAALVVGVSTFVASFARPLLGQRAIPTVPTVGRYQIASSGSSAAPNLFVIDTVSGKSWHGAFSNDPAQVGKLDWTELNAFPLPK